MSLEIIFAEFGDRSAANQKWVGDIGRLDPTYSQVKKYFPEAKIICYSDDPSIDDIAISMDSDLMFVSDEVRTLLPIIDKFGICCPQNERQMVRVDGIYTRGNDGDYHIGEDETNGNLLTYDLWWIGLRTNDERGRVWLKEFQRLMETNPKRGPLQLSRAAWNTGVYPYASPKQFGVGSGHIGCGNEIILHVGHDNVQDYYLERRI